MKECYFTPENIQAKSLEMMESLQDYRRSHDNLRFHPDRAALLVLDMQEYFLSQASHAFIPSAPAIIPNIQSLIKIFVAFNRPIIFTRHLNTEENAGMMGKWWKDLIRPHTAYSHVVKHLDTSKGTILHKSQYDAFYETPLESDLRAGGVGEVVVSGVMTHLCCETTARSAFMRGFEVFFTIDGTATYSESFHRATLLNLAHGFALPVQVEEILSAFK
ncbi:MAG: isochorismatase family protein [Anaerolineales bacterium]|nr:isochorismatase family protein [Anaerolineales bacterium]